jgi:YHS domain-containing protein/phenylpyruvate tautomerase PptA (4-oxalocrotonate tautomerase family)
MTLIELFIPNGSLVSAHRRRLSHRLVTELVAAPGAPPDLVERGRAITSVVVHEPSHWSVGGRDVEATDPPRYVVRVTVPAGHLNDGTRAEIVTRITRVLADGDDNPARLFEQPDAWVHLIEVPDGNIGAYGQILPTDAITNFVVHGKSPGRSARTDDAGPATTIDPICGMTVSLTDNAITLQRTGVTYGFCTPACRDIFASNQGSSGI